MRPAGPAVLAAIAGISAADRCAAFRSRCRDRLAMGLLSRPRIDACSLLAGRLPIVAAVGQVLVLAWVVGLDDVDALPFKVMASVAVFEAALTRPLRRADRAGCLLAAVTVWIMVLHQDSSWRVALQGRLCGGRADAAGRLPARPAPGSPSSTCGRGGRGIAAPASGTRGDIPGAGGHCAELHDVVAHHVASIALRSAIARDVLPDLDPAAAQCLTRSTGPPP